MFQLVYVSTLVPNGVAEFPSILEASVRNNLRREVTGMLLYSEGGILQVFEGEKSRVLETFSVVERDPRHYGIIVLMEEDIPERQFSAWSMGFKHLTAAELAQFPAGADVFQGHRDSISARVLQGYARTILQSFRSHDCDRFGVS